MKLREIEVENYGMFQSRVFQFGDGPFQLVFGPNEAGKTTLLQLIRELLFGFAIRNNPYDFPEHSGEMAATGLLELANGSRVRFRRRKGRINTVKGEVEGTGDSIDDAALAGLLGNATAELYEHVFGFSLAELASGEEGLKHARLGEALYGGGIGGLANFQRARAAMAEEMESLFSISKRATKPEVNRLLEQIHGTAGELKAAMVKPSEYKGLCEERDQCSEEVEKQRQHREECYRRQSHLDRLGQAFAPWLRLKQAKEELEAISVPESFPLGGGEEYRNLRKELDEVEQDLLAAETEVNETSDELGGLQLAPELMAEEPAIKALVQELGKIRSCREDIPRVDGEARTIRNSVLATLRQLDPGWGLDELEMFRASLAQRHRVEKMGEELGKLETRASSLSEKHREKGDGLAADLRELNRLKAIPAVPQLEHLCRRSGQYEADCEQFDGLTADLQTIDRQIGQVRGQLAGPFELPADRLELLPVPLESALQEFAKRFEEHAENERMALRSQKEVRRELSQRKEQLAQLDSQQRVPDRQELVDQRNRRDTGWRVIRRMHIEGEDVEGEVAAWLGSHSEPLADQYEFEVSEADRVADNRQEKAELVAQREQLTTAVQSQEERVAEGESELEGLRASAGQLQEEWRALWAGCGLTPQSPGVMLQWHRLHAELLEDCEERSALDGKCRGMKDRITAFTTELRGAMGRDEGAPEVLLSQAQDLVQKARDAALQRERLERELPGREQEIKRLGDEQNEVTRQREHWRCRWRDLLVECGFPPDWEVDLATKILNGLAEARRDYDKVPDLEHRLNQMNEAVTAFQAEAQRLCACAAPDLAALPVEEGVVQLNERLDVAKQAAKQHKILTKQRERADKRAADKRKRQESLQLRLDELRTAAEAETDRQFEAVALGAERKQKLSDEIASLQRDIQGACAGEDPGEFEKELQTIDADSFGLDQQQAKEALEAAEEDYRKAVEQGALANNSVENLDKESQVSELVQSLESGRAELRAAVDHWAPLVLASALMEEAIQRFEREHQPAMLQNVGELFACMTHNRYVGLRRRLDESGTILVELADGGAKEPKQLSTGTREQLYLAIRLAYARHYCRANEPLPLVMDDVLVNFDDSRADGALEVLLSLGEHFQVVFLTCHQSTIDRIKGRLPGLVPIELQPA